MGFSRKETMSTRDYEEKNQRRINAIYGCAYSFVSAITKQRLLKALEATVKVLKTDNNVSLLLNLMNTC
jgi:GTP-binding protein